MFGEQHHTQPVENPMEQKRSSVWRISANATGVPCPEQGVGGVSSSQKSNRHEVVLWPCKSNVQFSDEISELLSPFKSLLKKGTKFDWLPKFQTAFEQACTHLSSTKALAFYDVTKPTRLIADASRLFRLGFILKQEVEPTIWKTVQAGS